MCRHAVTRKRPPRFRRAPAQVPAAQAAETWLMRACVPHAALCEARRAHTCGNALCPPAARGQCDAGLTHRPAFSLCDDPTSHIDGERCYE